ncbi:hypothetical protein [Lysobacter xanthus]
MSGVRERLDVGWQSRAPAVAGAFAVGVFGVLVVAATLGPMPGIIAALALALAAGGRMQWAALDGCALLLRETATRYVDRAWPARRFAGLRFQPSRLPWCRLAFREEAGALVLVASGPSPGHPDLRTLTVWMIVHGRRRARIDPRLLDGLVAMPEHGAAHQPHDASPA